MDSKEKILTSSFAESISLAKKQLYRDMPWRHANDGVFDAYHILVSEMMLQQTQVSRVIEKYLAFIAVFPTVYDLADAQLSEVLRLWNGLGYNRRAKYLHDAAKLLASKPQPWSYEDLVICKGVGPNTAKAVLVYAYNKPELFIETNIRTVLLFYFFKDSKNTVTDTELSQKLTVVIDSTNPREWYWAMMDLGALLKQSGQALLHKSHVYKKQSKFSGSTRQIRGKVLQLLGDNNEMSHGELQKHIQDDRLDAVLTSLCQDGLIWRKDSTYYLGTGL